jgi:hypothetical protein
MNDFDRPVLGLEVDCTIETARNEIDTSYWHQLAGMQVTTPLAAKIQRETWPVTAAFPPVPKSPTKLRLILSSYACALFDNEARFYPSAPRLDRWLKMLADRIAKTIMETVVTLEAGNRERQISLDHHGVSQAQMREAIITALSAAIEQQAKAHFIAEAADQIKANLAAASHPSKSGLTSDVKPKRLSATIHCPKAARQMEDYIAKNGLDQTKFAIRAGTTDRTLRSFRQTGRVRRDIFENIAKAMGTTKEALLKD